MKNRKMLNFYILGKKYYFLIYKNIAHNSKDLKFEEENLIVSNIYRKGEKNGFIYTL